MILQADARRIPLADGCVQTVVTSPPYWGLRDYGVSGQIGLEPTPELYVETIVQVFREVRRVLRDDGTVWLNLGDSYYGSWQNYGGGERGAGKQRPIIKGSSAQNPVWEGLEDWRPPGTQKHPSLKPKDLIGIPWRVAFALQQPYYAGRIKRIEDRIWLAAMIDGEGCIHVHRRPAGRRSYASFTRKDGSVTDYVRTQDTYGVMVSVDNTSKAIVDRCEEIVGQGSRYTHHAKTGKQQRKQTLYRWTVTGQQSRELLRELYPYLVAKQQQARIAYWAESNGLDASAAHEAIKALHKGLDTTVDVKPPPSCFESGWYLRSDVIWSKLNPMPESVTDRPTRSHEYLFLLSKSERYFYDAKAIMEPASESTHARIGQPRILSQLGGDKDYGGNRSCRKALTNYAKRNGVNPKAELGIIGVERQNASFQSAIADTVLERNKRDVWTVNSEPTPEAHFATFPQKLIEPCILAGSRPGDLIFDPFLGSGTTGKVAERLGRKWVGLELSPAYIGIAKNRTRQMGLWI